MNLPKEIDLLCDRLSAGAALLGETVPWPQQQLNLCGEAGLFRWFVPVERGGAGWSDVDIVDANLRLSAACLTTTFVLTQLTGALKRISNGENQQLRELLLPALLSGDKLATLGISHLTTSRQHVDRPVLRATETSHGYVLNGFSPWVTGGDQVDYVLTGAVLPDGRQLLVVVPLADARPAPHAKLLALTESCTGAVHFDHVEVPASFVVAGPAERVMQTGVGARTGGLQTSTLALGLASAAIQYVHDEAGQRGELADAAHHLQADWDSAVADLRSLASHVDHGCTPAELRSQANSLVLRATQAAMVAAKGAGYVDGHPAGRWCRQALFFLVWSCPQEVSATNLCEFARIQ